MMNGSWMKTLCVCGTVVVCAVVMSNAGPLVPPAGPIAPTMVMLEQVNGRIPITPAFTPGDGTALRVIEEPGSYYLTGDLIGTPGPNGIDIRADHVTIDLNGYQLLGAGPGSGIVASAGFDAMTIFGGTVRGWGGDGIGIEDSDNARLRDLRVTENGGRGIAAGWNCSMIDVQVLSNGMSGVEMGSQGRLERVRAENNAGDGVVARFELTALDCVSAFNGGDGFRVGPFTRMTRVDTFVNDGHGVIAENGARLVDVRADFTGGDGFNVGQDARMESCTAGSNDGAALRASGELNAFDCRFTTGTEVAVDMGPRSILRACDIQFGGEALSGVRMGQRSTVVGCTIRGQGLGSGDEWAFDMQGDDCLIEGNTIRTATLAFAWRGTTGARVVGNRWFATHLNAVAGNSIGAAISMSFADDLSLTPGAERSDANFVD